MKKKDKIIIFLNIIVFFTILLILYNVFKLFFTMDLAVSSTAFLNRTTEDLQILRIRKIIMLLLSFFSASIIDFQFIKQVLCILKIEKYKKRIFIFCLILSLLLLIGIIVFYNVYSLI